MQPDAQLIKEIKKADLRYISDASAGFSRQKQGNDFSYLDVDGKKITTDTTLERIKNLVIPPAWTNVWICPSTTGYLQATGIDDRGRKQYIYHTDWVEQTQENKFNSILDFAEVLPKIRNKIYIDMQEEELEKDKIIATVIWLLEHTFIRIGNEEYAKENNSFGLTTLRNKHVKVRGKEVTFEFKGKSGIEHTVSVSHPKIAKIIKECIELPGYEIFQYVNDDGSKHTVDSADVNQYLKIVTGEDITAKDFRTWGATVLSAETLHRLGPAENATQLKKNIATAVKKAASNLRNTTTVCRKYYIHPVIIETYQKNILIPHFEKSYANFDREKAKISRPEYATLTLLQKYS